MAVPSLDSGAGSVAVPTSMATRGVYKFTRRVLSNVNGAGVAQAAGGQDVSWSFSYMTPTEYAWWYTTMCGGALSISLTRAELWDDLKEEQTFTSGILYRPAYDHYSAGLFRDVVVEIKHLLAII